MKKVLLGLSCLLATAISFQALADARTETAKRLGNAARNARTAVSSGRAIVGEGEAATTLSNGVRSSISTGGAVDAVDTLFGANAQGSEIAYNEQQCDPNLFGGVDTSDAVDAGTLKTSACLVELSHTAKGKFARAAVRAGRFLKGLGVTMATALKGQLVRAKEVQLRGLEEEIDGVPNGGPVDYNEVVKRHDGENGICTSCRGLSQFCAI